MSLRDASPPNCWTGMAYTNPRGRWWGWVRGASGVGEAEVGNVFNTSTDSEFRMAANSLTRLQEDRTIVYELKPSQLGVCTSLFDKTGFAESKRAPGLTSKRRPLRASPSLLVGGRLTKKPTALVSARAQRAFCIGWVRGMFAQISNFTCGASDYLPIL